MTMFYLVRHGKTQFNNENRFQGGTVDSPLLPSGIEQAIQLGKFLKEVAFDEVAVSTQLRAMDTAQYIIKENQHINALTVRYYDALREISFGQKDGQPVEPTLPQTVYLRTQPHLYDANPFPEGETFAQLSARALQMIETLEAQYPKGRVLIVAHGVLLITLINRLLGKEKAQWRTGGPLQNTSITQIDKQGQAINMLLFNDTSYQNQF